MEADYETNETVRELICKMTREQKITACLTLRLLLYTEDTEPLQASLPEECCQVNQ